jgi:serralysin
VAVEITGLDWDAGAVMDVLSGRSTATLYDLVDATPWNFTGSAFADSFTGGRYADTLKGGGGNDTMLGALGNDTIDGGTGNDRMEGGLGNDKYLVDSAGDQVRELAGEGYDTIVTSSSYALGSQAEIELLAVDARALGAIALTGNSFGQTLRGNAAANTLAGGAGADVLEGRGGSDVLLGNGPTAKDDGATDVFKFLDIDSGTATIWGSFNNGAAKFDRIDLSAIDANGIVAGNGAFEFIGTGKFGTGPEGQVRLTAATDGYIVSLDTDTDTAAEMQFFVHTNTVLRAGDFIL